MGFAVTDDEARMQVPDTRTTASFLGNLRKWFAVVFVKKWRLSAAEAFTSRTAASIGLAWNFFNFSFRIVTSS